MVERGDRSVIDTFFDEGLEGTNFHGNIVDICPVGALLSKDFLFKQRAWDLDHVPRCARAARRGATSTCTPGTTWCSASSRGQNLDVNAYWMCDYGRLSYEWINRPDRIEVPPGARRRRLRATGWKDALGALAAGLSRVRSTVVSARPLANEDLGAVRALVDQLGGGRSSPLGARARRDAAQGLPDARAAPDLAPNVNGAELLG